MLAEIVTQTPLWVWALLAFLIYRGMGALKERPFLAGNVLPLPLILTAWGLVGMLGRYPGDMGILACWAAGFLAAAVLGYASVTARAVHGTRAAPRQAGSAVPLMLVVSIFVVKYVTEVAFAMHPELLLNRGVSIAVALLFGALAGLMAGRVLRLFARVRALQPEAQQARTSSAVQGPGTLAG